MFLLLSRFLFHFLPEYSNKIGHIKCDFATYNFLIYFFFVFISHHTLLLSFSFISIIVPTSLSLYTFVHCCRRRRRCCFVAIAWEFFKQVIEPKPTTATVTATLVHTILNMDDPTDVRLSSFVSHFLNENHTNKVRFIERIEKICPNKKCTKLKIMQIFRIYRIVRGGRDWIFDAHFWWPHRNFSKFTNFAPILTSDRKNFSVSMQIFHFVQLLVQCDAWR